MCDYVINNKLEEDNMTDIDAKIRKLNSKMISILNRNGVHWWVRLLRKENKKEE